MIPWRPIPVQIELCGNCHKALRGEISFTAPMMESETKIS